MKKPSVHTVYNSQRAKWENKVEGSSAPVSSHRIKEGAVDKGQKLAQSAKVEHFVHGKDGKIQERNTYGHDPFPPRG